MNEQRQTYEYQCKYCFHKFTASPRTVGGIPDQFGRKTDRVSDQVRCSNCKNFLKTYGDIL